MKIFKAISLIIISLIFINCDKKKEETNFNSKAKKIEEKSTIEKAENFDQFNKKFHSDSLFQVSRVDFPIDGKHISGFEQYNWTKENWEFLAVPVAEKTEIGEYQHSLVKTDTLITERFWIPDSGFEVERQFKLIDNKWFLIYYNDINL